MRVREERRAESLVAIRGVFIITCEARERKFANLRHCDGEEEATAVVGLTG